LPGRVFALRGESDQLAELLEEARTEAGELAKDADETESLIRSDVSWQTHAVMLDSVKEHVNNMARIIDKLTAARSSGSELQEQAVDRILPLLKELATNTTNAINYLNENKTRPLGDPYTQYLRDNADTAHQLASTVSSLFEYEKTMNKMGELKNKLELNGQ
jgi:agmatine/peptidylarginine deiminase